MRFSAALFLPPLLALSACVDYLNHRDTITLAAGDTQHANIAIQTIDPWPPSVSKKTIDYDGQRAAAVIAGYTSGGEAGGGGAYSGNCLNPGDRDAAGNLCGKRSARDRPGGATGNEPRAGGASVLVPGPAY